jgi:ferrous iron transport protein B
MSSNVKRIVLVGNPNVGKSLVFSRITGAGVMTANYPGTTVEIKKAAVHYRDHHYEMFDIPGIYSLEAFSKAEEAALRMIDEADSIINIVDSTTLERNLTLTLQLIEKGKPMVVCLNLWDDTKHKGIVLDSRELENLLEVPVVTTSALRNEGINDLVASLERARTGAVMGEAGDGWARIGLILKRVQKLSHRHHTFLEILGDVTLHPVGGIACAAFVIIAAFAAIRFLGEGLSAGFFEPVFSRHYLPFIVQATSLIPAKTIQTILVGMSQDPLRSFGILTSGVYIALVLVFPYFFSFYLIFGFLEDLGYLPRLAVVLDPVFHRLGLHGHSSIPIMLGFGCKVPAFLAARVLTGRRERILTLSLCLMGAPCLPQSAMIATLGMRYGPAPVCLIFFIVLMVALCLNAILRRLIKGEPPELFIELPSYRFPSLPLLGKKLWMRIADYFREIFPLIIAGVLIIHVLESLGVLEFISGSVGSFLALALGMPRDIAPVLLLGVLRKDVSIALLAPFRLSAPQFVIASVFMVLYLPCIASFFVLLREMGAGVALKIVGMTFCIAVLVGALLHGAFMLVP